MGGGVWPGGFPGELGGVGLQPWPLIRVFRDWTGPKGPRSASPSRKSSLHHGDLSAELQRPGFHPSCRSTEGEPQNKQCGGLAISRLLRGCSQPEGPKPANQAAVMGEKVGYFPRDLGLWLWLLCHDIALNGSPRPQKFTCFMKRVSGALLPLFIHFTVIWLLCLIAKHINKHPFKKKRSSCCKFWHWARHNCDSRSKIAPHLSSN